VGDKLTNKATFQALILPDDRFTPWDAQSTASPDGGRAAVSTASALHIEPVDLGTGAPSQGVQLTCTRSGLPAPTDGNQAASYVAEHITDGITYGLDECYHLTGVSSALDAFSYGRVSLCTTSTEKLVGAATRAGTDRVYLFSQENDASAPTVHAGTASQTLRSAEGYPAVFAYGDGLARLLYVDQDTTTDSPIRVGVTTLDGSSVERDGVDVLGDGLQRKTSSATKIGQIEQVTGMAAAARGDEVLLVMAVDYPTASTYRTTARSTLRQYASTDGGLSFRFIGELPDTAATDIAAAPVVVATDAGFDVYYAGWTGTLSYVYRRAIGSAYAPLSAAVAITTATVSAASLSSGVMTLTYRPAVWTDHRGVIFSIGEEDQIARSDDGGLTFDGAGRWARQNSLDTLQAFSATYHRGQAVIAIDRASTGVSTDSTLSLVSLGGWSNYTWGPGTTGERDRDRPQWSQVYVPAGGVQRLTDVSVSASSVTQTLSNSRNRLTSSVSEGTADIVIDLGTSHLHDTGGVAFEVSGATTASKTTLSGAYLEYPLTYDLDYNTTGGGATKRHGVRVTHEDGEIKLWKRTGSGTADFTEVYSASVTAARVDVRVMIRGEYTTAPATAFKARAWYREQPAADAKGTSALRSWTAFGAAVTLSDVYDASAPSNTTATIITRIDSGDSADLHYWAVRGDSSTDYNLDPMISASGYTPRGAEFAYRPLYVRPDIVIRAVGGAARGNDTHDIAAAYDYGPAAALTADARAGFKEATGTTADLELAYQISTAASNDVVTPGQSLAVVLIGANFGKYQVQTYSGGAWAVAGGTVDVRIPVAWLADGQTVRPDPANNTSGPLVREGEFDGDLFIEDTTSTDAGVSITSTIGGVWQNDNFAPQLHCDGAPGAASGTNGAIVPHVSGVLINTGSAGIQGIRIVVDADERAHAGGQLEIGRVVIGRFLPHGTAYSWGRVVTMEPGATATELRDRTSRRVVDAQPRRIVEISWSEGLMTRGASTDDDDPDYYTTHNRGQAGHNMTAWEVYGILQRLNGAAPVVYVPRINTNDKITPGNFYTWGRRDALIYGRIEGPARWEVVLGDEGIDEVVRGLGFTIREIV